MTNPRKVHLETSQIDSDNIKTGTVNTKEHGDRNQQYQIDYYQSQRSRLCTSASDSC